MSETTQLVRYDAMCSAIAAAYSVDEVKDIRDKARAIEVYARQAKNTEAERQACEIRLRAERKCGQMLADMDKLKGRPGKASDATTLSDLGLSRDQSSQWQKLADVPEDEFEEALDTERPTTNGIITAHSAPKQNTVDPRALWLWGRLQDFVREGLLAEDPNKLVASMLEHMQSTTRDLAPSVCAWLGRIGNDG